jgi:thiol-disulfide isomerase/thioredoxin
MTSRFIGTALAACLACSTLSLAAAQDASPFPAFPIKVVDPDGKPVEKAVLGYGAMWPGAAPSSGMLDTAFFVPDDPEQFIAQVGKLGPPAVVFVLAAAPGYAFGAEPVHPPFTSETVTVQLQPARELTVRLLDPEGQPFTRDATVTFDVVGPPTPEGMDLGSGQPQGEGVWTFSVPREPVPALFAVDAPNFVANLGFPPVEIDLGTREHTLTVTRGADLTVSIEAEDAVGATGAHIVSLARMVQVPGSRRPIPMPLPDWIVPGVEGGSFGWTFRFIPPGQYALRYMATNNPAGAPVMMQNHQLVVEPGVNRAFELAFTPPDVSKFRGKTAARIKVADSGGKPVAGLPFRVVTRTRQFPEVELASGTLDAGGEVVVADLLGGGPTPVPYYVLDAAGEELASFALKAAEGEETVTITKPPAVGDAFPDFGVTHIDTGRVVRTPELKGKVVYVDFWATWCGPCQEPMAHLVELSRKNKEKWGDRVALMAISGDEELQTVLDHVRKNDWGGDLHYFANVGGSAFRSEAYRAFNVTGIPTAVLVAPDGRITFIGHPVQIDLEREIDALLAKGK